MVLLQMHIYLSSNEMEVIHEVLLREAPEGNLHCVGFVIFAAIKLFSEEGAITFIRNIGNHLSEVS
jgi:hypothetical protein